MAEWVALADLKSQMGIADDDTRDDVVLERSLSAAVAFVERVHKGRYNFADDPTSTLPAPTGDIVLGALMLARRFKVRGNSPDGVIQLQEMGTARVASFDPDIDRLLRLGRHARAVVG